MGSATALTDCELMRVDKRAMIDALHREHAFSDLFMAYLLERNIRYQEDLVDQLFNSSPFGGLMLVIPSCRASAGTFLRR